jgi:phospholipase D-like protein
MGKALLVVIVVVLFVYALFDLIATPSKRTRYLPKPLWFVVLLLVPIGPLVWLGVGRVRRLPGGGRPKPTRTQPPPGPRGPDDDPDYLRNL